MRFDVTNHLTAGVVEAGLSNMRIANEGFLGISCAPQSGCQSGSCVDGMCAPGHTTRSSIPAVAFVSSHWGGGFFGPGFYDLWSENLAGGAVDLFFGASSAAPLRVPCTVTGDCPPSTVCGTTGTCEPAQIPFHDLFAPARFGPAHRAAGMAAAFSPPGTFTPGGQLVLFTLDEETP